MQKRSTADHTMLVLAITFYLWIPVYARWDAFVKVISDPGAPAWVQAIGSLLAVGAVFVVWRLDRGREEFDAVNFSKAFGRSLVGALDRLIRAAKAKDDEAVVVAANLISEAYSIGKDVPLHHLPSRQQAMMVELRALAVMVIASIDRCGRSSPRQFDALLADADESARKALSSMHKGGVARVERA